MVAGAGPPTATEATAQPKQRLARRDVVATCANDNYGVGHSVFKELVAACQKFPCRPQLKMI